MVLLTITPAAKVAIDEYCKRQKDVDEGYSDEVKERHEKLSSADVGSAIEHTELLEVSKFMVQAVNGVDGIAKQWRLETLLKGANIYKPPPPPKREQVCLASKLADWNC